MTRKKLPLAIAALTAGMFGSSVVYALGLGEIKLYSHLNEPLQAEIDLLQVGDLNADEIVTKLAPKEAFEKAGIDRDFFLTQIKFEVVLQPDGRGVLKLSTDKPTREPFLDFILDTSWSNGHVLKQFTLLLDPPTYTAEGAVPTVSKPAPEDQPTPVTEQYSAPATDTTIETQATTTAQEVPQPAQTKPIIPAGTEHYTTQKNDTLWRIASAHQVSGASVYQTMDAIQKLNSDAFIKNNRNLLKTDRSLRLPSPEEVAYLSQGGSVSQLLTDQHRAAEAPQLSTDQASTPTTATVTDDKLKIVGASQTAEGGVGSGTSSAGTSESIDKIDRDNQDMNARLAELTSQIKTMQQLIQLQDDQLTALQQKLGSGATTEEKRAAVQKLKDELTKVESEINKESATASSASLADATTGKTTTDPTTATPTAASTTPVVTDAATVTKEQPTVAPTTAPVATQAPVTKPVEKQKPVETAPVEEESSSSWIVILVGLLLGAGVAGAVFGKKFIDKRKAQQQGDTESDWSVEAIRNEPSLVSAIEAHDEEQKETEEQAEEFATSQTVQAPTAHIAVDPLEEANNSIARGDLSSAINVLKEAISENATRLDLRTRLLELSVDAGDIATFEAQEAYISRWGGAAAKQRSKELREVVNAMPSVAPSSVEEVEMASPTPAIDSSLDFDIDTTSSTIETPVIEKTPDDELVSLEHLFDEAPTATNEASVEEKSPIADDLAALEHLFDESPAETKTEQTSALTEDLASLDHLFDDTPATEPAAASVEVNAEEVAAPVSDELASLDHLFDDAPAETKKDDSIEFDLSDFETQVEVETPEPIAEIKIEEPAASDVDFSSELGLLDFDTDATASASSEATPELPVQSAAEEPAAVADLKEASITVEPEFVSAPEPEQKSAPATGGEDDEFGFLAGTDEAATKLDLAKAYIDMEDIEGAKDILQEVLQEGNAAQQQEAKDLLARL